MRESRNVGHHVRHRDVHRPGERGLAARAELVARHEHHVRGRGRPLERARDRAGRRRCIRRRALELFLEAFLGETGTPTHSACRAPPASPMRARVGPILPPTPSTRMSPSARADPRELRRRPRHELLERGDVGEASMPHLGACAHAPQLFCQSSPRKSVSRPSASKNLFGIWNIASNRPPSARPRPRGGCRPGARRTDPAVQSPSPTDQAAFEHVGLLDLHVLVMGQARARRHLHERGEQRRSPCRRAVSSARCPRSGSSPTAGRDVDEARSQRPAARRVLLRSLQCSPTLTIFIVLVPPPCRSARRW